MTETSDDHVNGVPNGEQGSWRKALLTGFAFSFAHRLLLGGWMAAVWLSLGQRLAQTLIPRFAFLPDLDSPLTYALLGVWRRWDTIHYYNLALNGYSPADPGPTVFSPLTPLTIRLFNIVLPGPVDVAALVMSTLAFGVALALLYRVCDVYYRDARLGQWALLVTVLLPLSYFFSAPMSESLYLAAVLGVFLAAAQGKWWLAGLAGFFAALTRNQGVALFGVALLILLEQQSKDLTWQARALDALKKSVPLMLIVLGYGVFIAFRASRGLPPLVETYYEYSYHFFTDPLTSLYYNARSVVTDFPRSLLDVNMWALLISTGLGLWALRFEDHRRLPLLAYTFGYLLLFISKVNWFYGTRIVDSSGSIGRYSLALFPLIVLIADRMRHWKRISRMLLAAGMGAGLLLLSALHVLFLGAP